MANVLRIILKVTEQGLKNLEEVAEKLDNVATSLKELNEANEGLENIGENIENINNIVNVTSRNVVKQSQQIAEDSIGRLTDQLDTGAETLIARAGAVLITIGGLKEGVDALFGTSISGTAIFSKSIAQITAVFDGFVNRFGTALHTTTQFWAQLTQGVFSFTLAFQSVLGLLGTFIGGIAGFVTFNFLLGETTLLLRRIFGRGTSNLTVLERATRVIYLFDEGLNRSFITFGKFVKLGIFGIVSFFNPLLGGIPLLNTVIDLFTTRVKITRDIIGRFFGDSRASFQLIIQEIRKFSTVGLPIMTQSQEVLKGVSGSAKEAGKSMKGMTTEGQRFGELSILKSAKLPLQTQIPLLRVELRAIFIELQTAINQIFVLLGRVFGFTDEEIADIALKSREASEGVRKNINESGKLLQTAFETKSLKKAFDEIGEGAESNFRIVGRAIKGFFLFDITKIFTVPFKGAVGAVKAFVENMRNAPPLTARIAGAWKAVGDVLNKSVLARFTKFTLLLLPRALGAIGRLVRGRGVTQREGEPEKKRLSLTRSINEGIEATKQKTAEAAKEGNKVLGVLLRTDRALLSVVKLASFIPQIGLVKPFQAAASVIKEMRAKKLQDDLMKSAALTDKLEKEAKEAGGELVKQSGVSDALKNKFTEIGRVVAKEIVGEMKRANAEIIKTQQAIADSAKRFTVMSEGGKTFQRTAKAVNSATAETAKNIGTATKEVKTLEQTEQRLAAPVQTVNKELEATKKFIGGLIKDVLLLSSESQKIPKLPGLSPTDPRREKFKGGVFGKQPGAQNQFETFVKSLILLASKEGDISKVNDKINAFTRTLGQIVNVVKPELKDRLEKVFKILDVTKLQPPKDTKRFQKAIEEIFKAFKVPKGVTVETAAKAAAGFTKELREQFTSGKATKEVEAGILALIEIITSLLPSSPAKRGPLKNLPKMGSAVVTEFVKGLSREQEKAKAAGEKMATGVTEGAKKAERSGAMIPALISQGIKRGIGVARKAANDLAKAIAGYFPQSLPLFGPLKKIVKAGFLIPSLLAKGINAGIGVLQSVIQKISELIMKPIEEAAELSRMADRVGLGVERLSQLDFAMKSVGGSATELEFIMVRLNKTVAGEFTEDQARKFSQLGIDLVQVQKSAEPNVALLLEFSKILQGLPADSKEFQLALELLGVTAGSKLVNVLQQGPEAMKALFEEGVKTGGTITKEFAENSKKATELFNKLKAIRDKILVDLINAVLPEIVERGQGLLKLIDEYQPTIKTIINLVTRGIGIILRALKTLFDNLFEKPEETITLIFNVLTAIGKMVFSMVGDLFKKLGPHIIDLLVALGEFIFDVSIDIVKGLFTNLILLVAKGATDLVQKLVQTILDQLDAIDPTALAVLEVFVPSFEAGTDALKSFNRTLRRNSSLISANMQSLGDIIKGSVEENSASFDELAEAGAKLGAEFADPANLEIITKNFKETLGEVEEILAGTDFEPFLEEIRALFDAGEFEAVKRKFEEMRAVQLDAIGDILEAAKDAAEETRDEFDKTAQKFEDVARKSTLTVANILDEIRLETLSAEDDRIEREKINFDVSQRNFEIAQQERLAKLQQFKEEGFATEAQIEEAKALFSEAMKQRELDFAEKIERLKLQAAAKTLSVIGQSFGNLETMFGDLFELSHKKAKEFYIAQKAMAVAQAIINRAQAVTAALATGGPLAIPQAAVIAAMGTVQVAKIIATSFGFQKGGTVPGSGKGDKTIIAAEPGEKVIQNPAVAKYGDPVFDALNAMLLPAEAVENLMSGFRNKAPITIPKTLRFQEGGTVPKLPGDSPAGIRGAAAGGEDQQQPNIVNVTDPSIVGQFLAQSDGRRTLINILQDEREAIKGIVTS